MEEARRGSRGRAGEGEEVNAIEQAKEALRATVRELYWCNSQLVASGFTEGQTVTDALRDGRAALAALDTVPSVEDWRNAMALCGVSKETREYVEQRAHEIARGRK